MVVQQPGPPAQSEEGCGSGVSRCEGLETTSWGTPGGDDCTRDVKVHRGAIPRRGAHGADEPTCDAVGLGHPVERCLVTTVRRDGRWVCSKFQMSEDLADHLALCDDDNDPEGAATAKRAGGHLQTKDAPSSLAQGMYVVPGCASPSQGHSVFE